jgi:hypothetical protein
MHPQYKELSLDAAIIDPWNFLNRANTTGRYIATSGQKGNTFVASEDHV